MVDVNVHGMLMYGQSDSWARRWAMLKSWNYEDQSLCFCLDQRKKSVFNLLFDYH